MQGNPSPLTPKLGRLVNGTVLVSIPALYDDRIARRHVLLGIELNGLWLRSDEMIDRLLGEEQREFAEAAPAVFVPFAQITGVMVPTVPAPPLVPPRRPRASRRARPTQTDREPEKPPRRRSQQPPRQRPKT